MYLFYTLFLSLSSCVDRRNVFNPCWSWRHQWYWGTPGVGQPSTLLQRGVTHPGWANCLISHVLNPQCPHCETTRDTHPYTGPVTMVSFNSLHYEFKQMLLFISKQNVVFEVWWTTIVCVTGQEGCVEVILEQKDFRQFDGNPFTPLHCAVYVCCEIVFISVTCCTFSSLFQLVCLWILFPTGSMTMRLVPTFY